MGGNDTLNGLGGNDSLDGGAGDDSLTGGAGFDTLVGGTGNDTYVIDVTTPDKIVEDTLVGSGTDRIEVNGSFSIADPVNPPIGQAATGEFSGIEQLYYAGAANVTLIGNALGNTLQSDLGNDCLIGGAGKDTMIGGAGNDTYVIEGTGDVITELAGGGIDQINSADDVVLPAASEIENILLLGALPISAVGSSTNNLITGNSADNALRGELGNDTLIGNAGDDLLDGGLGADCLVGGLGNDTYVLDAITYSDGSIRTPDTIVENSGEGTDEIRVAAPVDLSQLPNFENVTLQNGGDFEVIGNALNNTLKGNTGNNFLDGGAGSDKLMGGTGNDSYIVDNAGDLVQEDLGAGTDHVVSYLDAYTLPTNVENLDIKGGNGSSGTGNTAPNIITGNQFDNVLIGLGGADTLVGGFGNDCLDGGNDARLYDQTEDSMVGGAGNDTYSVDNYQDSVVENIGEGNDKIELYPTLLSLDLTATSYTYSINQSNFTTSATAGTHVQFYLDKLQAGELNYNPAVDVPDDTAPALGSFELDGNYFYAMPDNVEDLTVKSKAIVVNNGQSLIGPRYAYGNAENNYITAISDLSVANDLPFRNYFDGQGGNDTMVGGLGNDTYIVDSSLDLVIEQSGEGTDLVFASTTYDLSANDIIDPNTLALTSTVENLTLLDSVETIVAGRPVLTALAPAALDFNGLGNSAANVIAGNTGNNSLAGAGGNDTISGGGGNDTIDGGTGNDSLTSGTGTDSLLGGTGNDTLNSGAGDDTLVGGAGNDYIDGGTGADSMVGGTGNDTYFVDSLTDTISELPGEGTDIVNASVTFSLVPHPDVENLTLTGAANLNGTGNALDNVITGNTGNNLIDGGAGIDTIIGGAGNDTYVVDSALDTITDAAGTDEVQSSVDFSLAAANVTGIENLTLTGAAVSGTGNALGNIITGNINNNILDGGAGVDTLIGGLGDDAYTVDNTADVVTEALGEGTDLVNASASYTLAANVENLTLTGAGNINGTGNALANIITGNTGNNILDGGAADGVADTLAGGLGDDTYVVDSLVDSILELPGEGTDLVQSSVNFSLVPHPDIENLTLTGAADINGIGNALNNIITGNTGNNLIDGGTGIDTMIGGAGNDTYSVDSTLDTITDAAGTDEVQSSVDFSLAAANVAGIENLTLTGLAVSGTGNAVANIITGNINNNILDGGAGVDTLIGDLGDDTYVVNSTTDRITEGAGGGTDEVQSSVSFNLATASNDLENLTLTGAGNINGTGNALANIITGNTGNNILDGGAADGVADTLAGGLGNDTYVVDSLMDTILELPGEGTDLVQSSVNFSLVPHSDIEDLTLTGAGDINGIGNALNNIITGNTGNNLIDGGTGIDTMIGGAGNDTYSVDSTLDQITEAVAGGSDEVLSSVSYDLSTNAANVENLTLTGVGNTNGIGNSVNNVITGNTGNNILEGSGGVDTLIGDLGDDTYVVDSTTDTITEIAGGGTDEVQSSVSFNLATASNDLENLTLLEAAGASSGTGNIQDNIITGNSFANTLSGGDGNDTLLGGAGDDCLDGERGENNLVGGTGNDTYVVESELEAIVELAGEGTDEVQTTSSYTLGSDLENLRLNGAAADNLNGWGNSLDNQLIGDGGDNHLYGYAGNDLFDGGAGNDTMVGGLGNDTYVVAQAGDVVAENLNQGTDLVQAGITYTLANNVENLTLTGVGNINGTGNALNNFITGNDGNNILDAGVDTALGSNTLVGGLGNDSLTASFGNNSLAGGIGDDTLVSGAGNDILDGGDGNDSLTSGDGNNSLTGGIGNDTLVSGTGDDTLDGGDGSDSLTAGNGNNSLAGGSGNDTLLAGTGNDTLDGGEGNDNLTSGDGNNSLTGGLGNDILLAGIGTDTLDGGAGNDNLDGGTGADVLIGGTGNDTYTVDNLGDTASETTSGVSGGTDIVNSSVTVTLGSNIENLTLTGAGNTNGTGNSVGNVIAGNAGDNILDGLGGRDTLDGGLGNDTLLGGALQDSLSGGGGNDSLDGGADDDFLTGTSAILAGASELDTLTGGTGGDAFVLGDATSTYYDTAVAAGDYALITDFSVATNDQVQLKTLAASGTNVNGYVVGTDIYATGGVANSWLYRDANNNSAADAGDNLIAAIQAAGGSGAGGALTTNDLNTVGYFV